MLEAYFLVRFRNSSGSLMLTSLSFWHAESPTDRRSDSFQRFSCLVFQLFGFVKLLISLDKVISQNQHIHFRPQKTIERLFGTTHDWFVFVEGGIEH